ncbi:hypothetical protein ONZ45_g11041 [Pleurotus djamor]|nr:hypothetical protein ONZ45_g11041 [Pleurotus djamor]
MEMFKDNILNYILTTYVTDPLRYELEDIENDLDSADAIQIHNMNPRTPANANAYETYGDSVINFYVCNLVTQTFSNDELTPEQAALKIEIISVLLSSNKVLGLLCHRFGWSRTLTLPPFDKARVATYIAAPGITAIPKSLADHLEARFGIMQKVSALDKVSRIVKDMFSSLIPSAILDYEAVDPSYHMECYKYIDEAWYKAPAGTHEYHLVELKKQVALSIQPNLMGSNNLLARSFNMVLPVLRSCTPKIALDEDGNVLHLVLKFIPEFRRMLHFSASHYATSWFSQIFQTTLGGARFLAVFSRLITSDELLAGLSRHFGLLGEVNWGGQGEGTDRVHSHAFYALGAYLCHANKALCWDWIELSTLKLGPMVGKIILSAHTELWPDLEEADKHVLHTQFAEMTSEDEGFAFPSA